MTPIIPACALIGLLIFAAIVGVVGQIRRALREWREMQRAFPDYNPEEREHE